VRGAITFSLDTARVVGVSIRAPRAGGDDVGASAIDSYYEFQSAPPVRGGMIDEDIQDDPS